MYTHVENHYLLPDKFSILELERIFKGFTLFPTGIHRSVDFYFDTFDGGLYSSGSHLRIRKDKYIQFKGPIQTNKEINSRPYIEIECANQKHAFHRLTKPLALESGYTIENLTKVATIKTIRSHFRLNSNFLVELPLSIMLHDYSAENSQSQFESGSVLEIKPLKNFLNKTELYLEIFKEIHNELLRAGIVNKSKSKYHTLSPDFLFGKNL